MIFIYKYLLKEKKILFILLIPYKIVSLLKSHKIMKKMYKIYSVEIKTLLKIIGIGVVSLILLKLGIVK